MNGKFVSRFVLGSLIAIAGIAPGVSAGEIARQADAKAQLRHAATLKKGSRGLQGEERREFLKGVAEAYAAVSRFFPQASAECTEAAFRMGEIRRSIKDREGALAAFEKAVDLQGDRKFSARAMLEIGHLHRRAKKLPESMLIYERVTKDFSDLPDQRDTAFLWLGKVRYSTKDVAGARSAWIEVAEKSADPLDRIRAYDLIAGSYLSEGNTAEASSTVEKCQHALASLAEEPSSKGARVKKALERMKTAAKLSPAVASGDDEDEDSEG